MWFVGLVSEVWVVVGGDGFWILYLLVLWFHSMAIGFGDVRQRYMGWVWAIWASGLYMASGPVV